MDAAVLTVSLTVSGPDPLWPTQHATLTATASTDIGPTPFYIRIFDDTTNTLLAYCGTGTTCQIPVTQPTAVTHIYGALITDWQGTVFATSGFGQPVTWVAPGLRLAAGVSTQPVGGTAIVTATSTLDIGPSPFSIRIYDATTNTVLATCGSGTRCSAQVSQAAPTTHKYVAYFGDPGPAQPQVTSAPAWVTWSDVGWSAWLSTPGLLQQDSATVPLRVLLTNTTVSGANTIVDFYDEDAGMMFIGSCTAYVDITGSCTVDYYISDLGDHHLIAFVPGNGLELATSNVATLTLTAPPPK